MAINLYFYFNFFISPRNIAQGGFIVNNWEGFLRHMWNLNFKILIIWAILRISFLLSGWRLWGRNPGAQPFLCGPQWFDLSSSYPRGGSTVWGNALSRQHPEATMLCALPRYAIQAIRGTFTVMLFIFFYLHIFWRSFILSKLNF